MIEVQRIAQESQREVREVVRGYREADLEAELAGAQGVLTRGRDRLRGDRRTRRGCPPEVQSALGWVVREATTNVLRHGDAGRCAVPAAGRRTGARGAGRGERRGRPDAPDRRPGRAGDGSGLAGLRERLAALGRHAGRRAGRGGVPADGGGPRSAATRAGRSDGAGRGRCRSGSALEREAGSP